LAAGALDVEPPPEEPPVLLLAHAEAISVNADRPTAMSRNLPLCIFPSFAEGEIDPAPSGSAL
jgi:hypothetical protein